MHILILPSWYPNFKGDINGSFFREQALALKENGNKVGVIYPQIRSLRDIKGIFIKPYGCHVENDDGVLTLRWHSVNFFFKFPNLARKQWINCGLRLFKEYIKKNGKPDVIHVHSLLNSGYLAFEIYKKYNIPYVITEHSSAFARGLVPSSVFSSLSNVVAHSSKCIAVSKIFCRFLEQNFVGTVWNYIPNIVNNVFLKEKLYSNTGVFELINICFLNKNKKVDLIIRAFAKALMQQPNLKLKIGGDGPERINLENLVQELNISHAVTFLGLLSREEVRVRINKASAFILGSDYETFGVVVVEALALGKPVISTKCGGPESIIQPEVGYLVEKNSIDEMAEAIINLYNNYDNYQAENIRKYCERSFSEQAVVDQLQNLYLSVIHVG
ncbi:glycosyltransferase [Acinetobacter baumannii]|uniref:glycosyltransferase n=1 Tax=Acinetobacter baumannii TaxID=470 RepID=UPI001ED2094A|nr:glycosyltransferase [Acinetobacter baumannii]EHU3348674.1 glycosyltransferase [Acinetobacter baumannii]MCF7216124.1 glycosyltransferase [Acinetobacter baumannii]MCT9187848.1 glycosyltransferase [Acinetobacter baumannii]MDC5202235.1 glycosyltransferase [Acinetobacter baumannii]MDV7564275.1 glycosyltransferase [Acinetobacter baumannii]